MCSLDAMMLATPKVVYNQSDAFYFRIRTDVDLYFESELLFLLLTCHLVLVKEVESGHGRRGL